MDPPKISFVTGGGAGLGRAIAFTLARRGDTVVIADRDAAAGDATVTAIAAEGGRADFQPLDVTAPDAVEAAIAGVRERHGRLDYAVNNAGIEGATAAVADYEPAEWSRVLAVNLTGVFLCLKFELQQMLRQGSGAVVNVGSTASLGGVAGMPAYTAAKHGLVGLTKAAALDCADNGIRVNAICPGSFRTAMSERLFGERFEQVMLESTPMRRIGSVDEIAQTVAFLCSDAASFITGVALPVEGGKRAR
jgi:NAD(P)-dependent dehydrogenase (short-subunit alcohol dehydrogenase family)